MNRKNLPDKILQSREAFMNEMIGFQSLFVFILVHKVESIWLEI